jgi:uncharacterized caspase-like protein
MTFNHGHALIIGVDSYRYAPRLDVSVASRDAEALAGVLSDPRYCGYPANQTRIISKADATRDNILNALNHLARQSGPDDTVVFFQCGHGDYGTDGNFYLICHDSQIEGDKVASGTGISQAELLEMIKAIPAQRLLMVFNSCHSGEISPTLGLDQQVGGKNLPTMTAEALLSTGSGRVVITACREDQYSWIGSGQLSIFTQALIDGLQGKRIAPRGGTISIFDLYTATFETVNRTVEEQLNKRQEPELTILKGVGPFAVALYQGALDTNMSVVDKTAEPPQSQGVRQVDPERSQQAYQQIINQEVGVDFGQSQQVKITGDVIGGDRVDKSVNTGGGAYVGGQVTVTGGDFVGRDKITSEASSSQAMILEDFLSLLERIHSEFQKTQPEAKFHTLVENEIASIKAEAHDEQPSLPIIETKLISLKNLLEKTGSVVVATTGLAKVIQQAIVMAQKLFQ